MHSRERNTRAFQSYYKKKESPSQRGYGDPHSASHPSFYFPISKEQSEIDTSTHPHTHTITDSLWGECLCEKESEREGHIQPQFGGKSLSPFDPCISSTLTTPYNKYCNIYGVVTYWHHPKGVFLSMEIYSKVFGERVDLDRKNAQQVDPMKSY